ncbi:unnamed protein product [Leptosia nina]|uniref:Uncharacterized protein n=1 Tax=Leptosia nina TaxID=320188 RepID=A0AAV1JDX3_9NEOP
MLLLHGVPESNNEDVPQVVSKILTETLLVPDASKDALNRCHRMGSTAKNNKPRPIVIKFIDVALRDRVWFKKTSLKGSDITMSEFLIKSRRDLFLAAREQFGISKCWTSGGSIRIITPGGSRVRVETEADLKDLIESSKNQAASSSKYETRSKKHPKTK